MHASRSLNGRPDKTRERPGLLDPGPVILQWKPRNERLGSRATYWYIGDEYQVTGSVRSDRVQQLPRSCGRENSYHPQLRSTPAFAIGGNASNAGVDVGAGNQPVRAGSDFPPNPLAEDCTEKTLSGALLEKRRYFHTALIWIWRMVKVK